MSQAFDTNSPIACKAACMVRFNGQDINEPVRLVVKLMPTPTVAVEYRNIPTVTQYVFNDDSPCVLTLDISGQSTDLTVMGHSYSFQDGSGTLISTEPHCTLLDTGAPLHSVEFELVNFPDYIGKMSDIGDGHVRWNRAEIQASPWLIEITGEPDLSDTVKEMRVTRGYGVTHSGRVSRADGSAFSPGEAESLLDALRLFLSFSRGKWCDLLFVRGFGHSDTPVWSRWGSRHIAPWMSTQSWFNSRNGGNALESFSGFWNLYNQAGWNEIVTWAIDWYLTSNEGPIHSGIILSQAALERLASGVISSRPSSQDPAGVRIANALKQLGIDVDVPASCTELDAFRQQNNFGNGPHTLTSIRNDFVHPEGKYGSVSTRVQVEAWNLSQWYIEILLLKRIGYKGGYWNRVTSQRDSVA